MEIESKQQILERRKEIEQELVDMLSETSPFKGQLTQYTLEHFEKQKSESFEKGKTFWTETAKKNLSQVEGVTNETLQKTKNFLYTLLDITPIEFNL